MTGDVDRTTVPIDQLGAATRHLVHDPPDRAAIPRNCPSGKHHHVVRFQHDVAMIVDRDPRERRSRLALRPGCDTYDVAGRVVSDLTCPNPQPGGKPQVTESLGDLGVLDDPASGEGQLAAVLRGEIRDDLDPMQAGRKCGHHDLAGGVAEDLIQTRDDVLLGPGVARAFDIRAVAEQRQHAAPSQLREALDIERFTVQRRLVEFVISRVYDDPGRRVNRNRHAVGDTMGDPDELELHRPGRDRVPGRDLTQAVGRVQPMFFEFRTDQRQGERRPVDRTVQERPYVGQCADVVLVAVRQHDGGEPTDALGQTLELGNDQVNTGQLRPRKHRPGIDEDRRLLPHHEQHVHPEFTEPAEWDYVEDRPRLRGNR